MEVQTFTLWTTTNRGEIDLVRGWYEKFLAASEIMARYAPQFSVVDEFDPVEERSKCNLKIGLTIVDDRAVGHMVFIVVRFAQHLREHPEFFNGTRARAGKHGPRLSGGAALPEAD